MFDVRFNILDISPPHAQDKTVATLPYAAPTHTQAPALVRPTKRTLLLLILTTATFYWLHTRHQPWRKTATLPMSQLLWGSVELTDDSLICCSAGHPFQTWDTRTGKLLFTSTPSSFTDSKAVCGGRYILQGNGD